MPSCLPSPPDRAAVTTAAAPPADDGGAALQWSAAWIAAQQAVEPDNALPPAWRQDFTLRQIVRLRRGGTLWRLRFSNAFSDEALCLGAAHIAPADAGADARADARIDARTDAPVDAPVRAPVRAPVHAPGRAGVQAAQGRALLFGGHAQVTIAAGDSVLSDPIGLPLAAGTDLVVSLWLPQVHASQTGHPGSRATSFVAPGLQVGATTLAAAAAITHWYWLSDVETLAPAGRPVLVAIGDSITDGRGSTTDGNDRWTDLLAERLACETHAPQMAVLNAGLGGNRLLHDGIGPSLRSRFARDVLQRAGVTHALLQIGINDLGTWREHGGHDAAAREAHLAALKAAYAELAQAARAQRIVLMAATVTPYVGHAGYLPDANDEAARQALNAWIRTAGVFAAVADFDAALRDPADPARVAERLHCGDHLHPSPAGLRALAEAVPLAALATSFAD